jgi:glycosyltransferase involved in cell wall biosynthesis
MTNSLKINTDHHFSSISPKKPCRVLMVAGLLRGYEGITSHIATLAQGLQAKGWEVGLACGLEAKFEPESRGAKWLEAQGIKYYPVNFPSFSSVLKNSINAIKTYQSFQSVIEQFQPDIIHNHSFSVSPFLQISRLSNTIPIVATCHMNPKVKQDSLETKLASWINRYLNSGFLGDRLISISREVKESYIAIMNIPEDNIVSIYHGIDSEHFRPPSAEERLQARKVFGLKENDQVVCLIGRLSPVKGHNILIEAISKLKERGINAIALCAGTGDWEANIRSHAAKLGVSDSIHLLGFTDSRQVIWASDVIVLPSQREALPLVICEAMLCGVVPIRTPASGVYDQIEDGIDGFVISFNNSEFLALRLQQLFENQSAKIKMSSKALKSASSKFTLKSMVDQTVSLYEEVINQISKDVNHIKKTTT